MQMPPLLQEDLVRLVSPLLYPDQMQSLGEGKDVVFTYALGESERYHVVVSNQLGNYRLTAQRWALA